MYAIVSIAGQQCKVEKGKKVFVHKLPGEIGDEVSFDKILLIGNDSKVNVGTPYLPDAVVSAQIVSQLRGDKVLVFKKKRRKGYQKLNGHRQYFTEILIEDIAEVGAPRKTEKKKAVEPKAEIAPEVAAATEKTVKAGKTATAKTAPKKAAPKASGEEKPGKAAPKKAAPKKADEASKKKPAAKKTAAKSEGKSTKK
jgi:large subunit ribosomal protein L21